METKADPALIGWLASFEHAVRAHDYAAARTLFVGDAHGFGTVTPRYLDLDALVVDQWQKVWPVTRDFSFDRDTIVCFVDGSTAILATTWSSTGLGPEGHTFSRRGRATLVLRLADGGYRCCHSHFSMVPT